ncbi:unnamed protein product [Pseudo-nitzschia multistriata]|uniref:Pyridoxamine 5'-phosphate oxidase putative domain-containing protein n=1 Tax=Pseudo-nitzschia multistriata TaxID=183589 RepID=A0A448ZNH3_9STRA|nr:unnamed protein product [Pseudo-nitzschia multistriata]
MGYLIPKYISKLSKYGDLPAALHGLAVVVACLDVRETKLVWIGIIFAMSISKIAKVGHHPVAFLSLAAASYFLFCLQPLYDGEGLVVLLGIIIAIYIQRPEASRERKGDIEGDDECIVRSIEELRQIMPAGLGGNCLEDAKKVIGYLDDQMINFIHHSPLIYLATVDNTTKYPFISPKGDKPGFVTVRQNHETKKHTLIIPDRPGNRLLFGLQNILGQRESGTDHETAKVSILFEVPGTGSTLRCGGSAWLSTDPALIRKHVARGCPPKVVILVDVDHAFFHCSKAYMRSKVWDPKSWPSKPLNVTFGRYFAKKGSLLASKIDSDVDKHYQQIQKAIDGEACEEEK